MSDKKVSLNMMLRIVLLNEKNKRHNTDKAEYIFHQILLLEDAQVTVCCNLYLKWIPRKMNKILYTSFVKQNMSDPIKKGNIILYKKFHCKLKSLIAI